MKIILENVDTKEQRVIEEENMITNGLSELIKGFGPLGGSLLGKLIDEEGLYKYKSVTDLFKGVMLFDSTIDEDVSHIYETDSEVVGCASNIPYTGANQKMGSYNATESGKVEGGYKFVWDFATSQANGEISCACLTTVDGGRIGYGFDKSYTDCQASISDFSSLRANAKNVVYTKGFQDIANLSPIHSSYFDGVRNRIYTIKNGHSFESYSNATDFAQSLLVTKSITFVESRFPFTNISALDNFAAYTTRDIFSHAFNSSSTTINSSKIREYESCDPLSEIEVKMPDELASYISNKYLDTSKLYKWYLCASFDEGYCYIYFFPPKTTSDATLGVSEDLYVWKISMSDFSSNYFKVRNTTGLTLSPGNRYTPNFLNGRDFKEPILVTNDYTYMVIGTNLYVIDNVDNTNVKKVKGLDGTDLQLNEIYGIQNYYRMNDNMYIVNYYTSLINNINPRTGVSKVLYCSHKRESSTSIGGIKNVFGTNLICIPLSDSAATIFFYGFALGIFPNLLMTINNLDTPVTKTNSETMKVIYTITQAEGA